MKQKIFHSRQLNAIGEFCQRPDELGGLGFQNPGFPKRHAKGRTLTQVCESRFLAASIAAGFWRLHPAENAD